MLHATMINDKRILDELRLDGELRKIIFLDDG